MAKGGAFGNPLTTGIALTFEVDATPYRQMMQDNLNFAKSQAAERKKKEKQEVAESPPSVEKVVSKPLKEKKPKKEKVVKNYITNNYIAPAAEEPKKPKPKAQRILIPPPFQFI